MFKAKVTLPGNKKRLQKRSFIRSHLRGSKSNQESLAIKLAIIEIEVYRFFFHYLTIFIKTMIFYFISTKISASGVRELGVKGSKEKGSRGY